ncbi:unnamed protein product [Symbiodinium natans]|uniref:Uncharacterized protein n=1 Tax=Symbiodinium natans TaxID=878477 RepID=A0A812QLJ1_9DINO|nr:unnamed protein product [Symbiodinium natans]
MAFVGRRRESTPALVLTLARFIVTIAIAVAPVRAFQVPAFLNCDGPPFAGTWSVFREAAVLNARAGYPRNESLRDMAVEIISDFEESMIGGARAWVVHLRTAATGDVFELRSHSTEKAAFMAQGAPQGKPRPLASSLQTSPQASRDPQDPMAFCLYGYVHALFVEYRHTVPFEHPAGPSLTADDPRRATCHDRRPLLQVAEQLLGGETGETDFLESSDWPLSSLDLHLSLHASLAFRSSPDCHETFDPRQVAPRAAAQELLYSPQRAVANAWRVKPFSIAALGLHVASTLEPVAALREAARRSGMEGGLGVFYAGHPCYGRPDDKMLKHACIHKCQMLGSPCEDDEVAEFLKRMFNSSGFYEEVPWSVPEALSELSSLWRREPSISNADIVVCSGPMSLCYLIDVLAPSTPLVVPVCSQLLWGAPPGKDFRAMLLGHVRAMTQNPRRVVVACNVFAASQCLYQTGVSLPVVERVAHYLPPSVAWKAQEADHWKEVLVLRARYWHRLPGQYFMDVLEAYLRLNEVSHNYTFVMAASFGPDELPPHEIANYRATVLVPNDLTVFAFIEVYALGVPIFVPHPSWLYRLRRAAPFGFLQPAFVLPDVSEVHRKFKYPPFLSGDGGRTDLFTFLFWQQTSELHSRPHVQQFGSIPELIQLASADAAELHAISRGMAEHLAQLRQMALAFWKDTLKTCLDAQTVLTAHTVPTTEGSTSHYTPTHITHSIDGFEGRLGAVGTMLDCSSEEHGAWNDFRRAFQINAASGFPINWELQAMAKALWDAVRTSPDTLAAASALFHQVLIGAAAPDLVSNSRHCHYGLVAALSVLSRHSTDSKDPPGQPGDGPQGQVGRHYMEMALRLLGGGAAALDFLEDSQWPLSSLDIISLQMLKSSCHDGCTLGHNMGSAHARAVVESLVPWTVRGEMFLATEAVEKASSSLLLGMWKLAVVGAHPSLCADIATALHSALDGRSEHRYFGLSCPKHHAASHHCSFRCEVLGQCENDQIFDQILSRMMNWAEFDELEYAEEVLRKELHGIVMADMFLLHADLQVCTGPYILCYMMQQVLHTPFLVYSGLALTYLASAEKLGGLLQSARSAALVGSGDETARAAFVVTDLVRAAQFHHATDIWVPVVPPLSLYQKKAHSGHFALHPRAIALRPELWRRAAFGPAFRGLLRYVVPGETLVAFQAHYLPLSAILSYDAALLIPWDNDVMSFFELYHAAMPLLLPSQRLMAKWLPAVRWGSLEYDRVAGGAPMCLAALGQTKQGRQAPWMNQSTLAAALEGGALGWIGATDYYRLPHVLHFDSVVSIGGLMQGPLLREASMKMRTSSQRVRTHALAFYSSVLLRLLGERPLEASIQAFQARRQARQGRSLNVEERQSRHWQQLPEGGTCRQGFITQADFAQADAVASAHLGLNQCLQLCDETAGCVIAAFNGLTCMVYGEECEPANLRREGDRELYVAWKRK